MREDLLPYYENELSFIRNMGKEFATAYGKIAARLALEPGKCDDPHVERLIEAFALIAGRIHHKIDDEFPEITEALLNVLYPHYLRPVPSMSIAQLRIDPEQALMGGHDIPERSALYTRPIAGKSTTCTFRTCYPVRLWPLEVTSAAVLPASAVPTIPTTDGAAAVVRISLKCTGKARLPALDLDRLRFYLHGESQIIHILYELLFASVMRVLVRSGDKRPVTADLPGNPIQPVGFNRDEGMLEYSSRSFMGYRVLQEYFAFPQKYLFFDITGFDRISRTGFSDAMDLFLYLRSFERKDRLQRLEQNVTAETFQLGCTPVVNLFEQLSEPVKISHSTTEYRVIPDIHRQATTEVYSVDEVRSHSPNEEKPRIYSPFYSMRHVYEGGEGSQAYWYGSRRQSARVGDKGTEVYLSLVNLQFQPSLPAEDALIVRVTCTNRDLAGELPLTGEYGELSLKAGALPKARTLMRPTKTVRPPLRRGLQWRLISHLALNYLSIVDGGRDALQEILKLYDFSEGEDPAIRKQIAGIADVTSQPHIARIVSEHGIVFAQGLRVGVELDEEAFIGAGVFLFAAVLERFLGLYTAINSFTQLTVRTRQRNGDLKQWPPRSGEQTLL